MNESDFFSVGYFLRMFVQKEEISTIDIDMAILFVNLPIFP